MWNGPWRLRHLNSQLAALPRKAEDPFRDRALPDGVEEHLGPEVFRHCPLPASALLPACGHNGKPPTSATYASPAVTVLSFPCHVGVRALERSSQVTFSFLMFLRVSITSRQGRKKLIHFESLAGGASGEGLDEDVACLQPPLGKVTSAESRWH